MLSYKLVYEKISYKKVKYCISGILQIQEHINIQEVSWILSWTVYCPQVVCKQSTYLHVYRIIRHTELLPYVDKNFGDPFLFYSS